PFPPSAEDAHCMLCQQPLEAEARARMVRFEDFIQKDTEQLAREAEKAAQAARQTIAAGAISTRAVKASLDDLGLQNEALQQQTRRFIAAARLRRHVLLKALG
ncbi:DNA repair protein, partial [Pseudomonas aeruginosa]|nr:DNA repair protein [Pseudomonas aeruginosa]